MCGIALILGPRPDRQVFGQMITTLAPRGEVEEILLTERLLAGTQRLRIVDADRAIQPFTSADGRWVLCYNGEVFNYRVLQAELTRLGHRLRTDSDTEVVLEAFLEWGAGAVTRLRGEFAFALADTDGRPGLPGPRPARRQAAVLVPRGRQPARGVGDQGAHRAGRPGQRGPAGTPRLGRIHGA